MITLYHNPQTRSLRIRWLLEELSLEHTLKTVEFVSPVDGQIFTQNTPTGRFPTLVDGEIVLCESGAIAQYLIERYGQGRLAPALDSPLRGQYLQWMHFPEGTLNPYINAIQRFKDESPTVAVSLSHELDIAVGYCDRALSQQPYIVGSEFSGRYHAGGESPLSQPHGITQRKASPHCCLLRSSTNSSRACSCLASRIERIQPLNF